MSTGEQVARHVQRVWAEEILPTLSDYIRIPCVSVAFDADWKAHGHLDAAVEMIRSWCAARVCVDLNAA